MKKTKVRQPSVKLGGGDFLLSYVLSFETKDDFVKANIHVNCQKDAKAYLSEVWKLANRDKELAVKKVVEKKQAEVKSEESPVVETTIKIAEKKKSEQKKE